MFENSLADQSIKKSVVDSEYLALLIPCTYNVCMHDLDFSWDPEKDTLNQENIPV
jgi:hypothetical protein